MVQGAFMSFNTWLSTFNATKSMQAKIVLLSYLDKGKVTSVHFVNKSNPYHDNINSILKRVYALRVQH